MGQIQTTGHFHGREEEKLSGGGQTQLWPAVLSEESWQGWKLALYILYSLPSPG